MGVAGGVYIFSLMPGPRGHAARKYDSHPEVSMKGESPSIYTRPVDVKNSSAVPVLALAGLFVVAGLAAPQLKPLVQANGKQSVTSNANGALAGAKNRWRAFVTERRMDGLRETAREHTRQRGTPPRTLGDFAGSNTSKDAWNHRFRYLAPTEGVSGYLISNGPNGKPGGKDDIVMKWKLQDMS